MGVIYVVAEAMKLGFTNGHPDWCNLGQGQPEVGPLTGAPPRIESISLEPGDHAYGPVGGTPALRERVAAHYNRLYRQGHSSQYAADNVSIAAGGRLALSRIFSALAPGLLGVQDPDYTAYADMINGCGERLQTRVLPTTADDFSLPIAQTVAQMADLDALLLSNPCNPTGAVISGGDLDALVCASRTHDCTLILDEFYSHFTYSTDGDPADGPVSAARHVGDVNRDPVLLVDGLTKCFRYPGWRVGWVVGPEEMIAHLGRAASALDGGPPQPLQRAACDLLEPARADQETTALRAAFARKRRIMIDALRQMGIHVPNPSRGTFYLWANLSDLPSPLDSAEVFFRRALEERVLTVPGAFFDIDHLTRPPTEGAPSRLAPWMRFSFGPPEDNVILGLDRLARMVGESRSAA